MTTIQRLEWDDSPLGDSALAVGPYQATVYTFAGQQHWIVFYQARRIGEGSAYTPQRAKTAAETAIEQHQKATETAA